MLEGTVQYLTKERCYAGACRNRHLGFDAAPIERMSRWRLCTEWRRLCPAKLFHSDREGDLYQSQVARLACRIYAAIHRDFNIRILQYADANRELIVTQPISWEGAPFQRL